MTPTRAQLENWVFESDKPDAELKLIDFGLSTYFGKVRVFRDSLDFLPWTAFLLTVVCGTMIRGALRLAIFDGLYS